MVFSSDAFLFLFLPVVLLVNLARGRPFLWGLVAASLLFYFWSSSGFVLLLAAIIVVNFFAARGIVVRPGITPLVVAANLLPLVWFKYAHFLAGNVDLMLGTQFARWTTGIVLPAGISFFVFQAISYAVDVRRGTVPPERRLATYAAYQSFFPHLIAGPIVRYSDVRADFERPARSMDLFTAGVWRFGHGLFKKVVIADGVAPVADAVFGLPPGDLHAATGWIGAIAFTLQIYFDFSGYSDMAIGLAAMFGIRFAENFERPYASRSMTEFWRRWHISLSSWFRDYVYIPLGGSRTGPVRTVCNLLIVFLLTGLWHGAAWTFVVWGALHGAFLMAERLLFGRPAERLVHPLLRYLYVAPAVVASWVVFRADSLGDAAAIWWSMVAGFGPTSLARIAHDAGLTAATVVPLAIGSVLCLAGGRLSTGRRLGECSEGWRTPGLRLYAVAAFASAALMAVRGGYSPFLYFRF